jgi:hyperosmotically inducible protein
MRAFTLSFVTAVTAALAFAGCDQLDTGKGPVVDSGRPNSDMPPATKTDSGTRVDPNLTPPVSPPITPPPTRDTTGDITPPPGTRPDNTAINQRDAADLLKAKTPIDQNENKADIDITAKIRQRVVSEKDFSINAQNVKIITADGMVTLRGPVNSKTEHDTIERIAREVAGEGKVDNKLEVVPQER